MATWLITGASSGLGRGIAEAALARGENVALAARDLGRVDDLVSDYPNQALAVYLDLGDLASIEYAVIATRERFGGLDVLVNNAGHGYRATVEESERERIDELFNTNFFAVGRIIRRVLPTMRSQRSGLIVNVSSIGAVRGALGNGYYSASKAALELLTEALEKEVAHLGIETMIVEPGAMRTGFFGDALLETRRHIADYDEIADRYRKTEATDSHDQPIDPKAAGRVVVEAIVGGNRPQRLLLGSDCVAAARAALEARLAELNEWADVSVRADFDNDDERCE
ncbi:SDR family NAD(P)-dependent oxidoreductase [Thermophilibacter provencensis]|uniref:SDR family NAD(P)-dependent oxidoreductase n=1 Tax=Thermophilibacter provencensis TaxID=1852386 RepID=UPI00094B76BC|nr:SDR family NAD(P)-dependent oxidoreductase [Thermophilibacter provencensis]